MRAMASASGRGRPVGTTKPVSPSAMISSRLACRLTMAGRPDRCDSSETLGIPSAHDGSTSASAA